jgi:molybdate transport system permease protein
MSWAPLVLSFEIAGVATLLAGALGTTLAGVISRYRLPGSSFVEALLTAPMVLPPTVLGYYLLVVLGRSSAIGRAFEAVTGSSIVFTPTGAVVAATLSAFPFVVKSARAAMDEVDPRLIGAAQTLGAGPLRVFFTVVLPLSSGGIVAGLTLGFARALGDFGVTLMVAGNLPGLTQTGALAIYDAVQANRGSDAAGMVGVMTALAIAALWWVGRLTRKRQHAW